MQIFFLISVAPRVCDNSTLGDECDASGCGKARALPINKDADDYCTM